MARVNPREEFITSAKPKTTTTTTKNEKTGKDAPYKKRDPLAYELSDDYLRVIAEAEGISVTEDDVRTFQAKSKEYFTGAQNVMQDIRDYFSNATYGKDQSGSVKVLDRLNALREESTKLRQFIAYAKADKNFGSGADWDDMLKTVEESDRFLDQQRHDVTKLRDQLTRFDSYDDWKTQWDAYTEAEKQAHAEEERYAKLAGIDLDATEKRIADLKAAKTSLTNGTMPAGMYSYEDRLYLLMNDGGLTREQAEREIAEEEQSTGRRYARSGPVNNPVLNSVGAASYQELDAELQELSALAKDVRAAQGEINVRQWIQVMGTDVSEKALDYVASLYPGHGEDERRLLENKYVFARSGEEYFSKYLQETESSLEMLSGTNPGMTLFFNTDLGEDQLAKQANARLALSSQQYLYMTEEERQTAAFLSSAERAGYVEKGTFQAFMAGMSDRVNKRAAQQEFKDFADQFVDENGDARFPGAKFAKFLSENVASVVFGAENYFMNFGTAVSAAFGGASAAGSEIDYKQAMINSDLLENGRAVPEWIAGTTPEGELPPTWQSWINSAFYSVGNMLPSIGAAFVANGLVPGLGSTVNALGVGASAAGARYKEMIQQGYTHGQALFAGAFSGAAEAALEKVLNGLTMVGGQGEISDLIANKIAKVSKGISNAALRSAVKIGGRVLGSTVSEVIEEELQNPLDSLFKWAATGDWDDVTLQDVAETAVTTIISTLILESPSVAVNIRGVRMDLAEAREFVENAIDNHDTQAILDAAKAMEECELITKIAEKYGFNLEGIESLEAAPLDQFFAYDPEAEGYFGDNASERDVNESPTQRQRRGRSNQLQRSLNRENRRTERGLTDLVFAMKETSNSTRMETIDTAIKNAGIRGDNAETVAEIVQNAVEAGGFSQDDISYLQSINADRAAYSAFREVTREGSKALAYDNVIRSFTGQEKREGIDWRQREVEREENRRRLNEEIKRQDDENFRTVYGVQRDDVRRQVSSDKEETKIARVAEVDGKKIFIDADGKRVNPSDAVFRTEDDAAMYLGLAADNTMSASTANALIAATNLGRGKSGSQFRQLLLAYRHGFSGDSRSTVRGLSEEQYQYAYNLGANDANRSVKAAQDRVNRRTNVLSDDAYSRYSDAVAEYDERVKRGHKPSDQERATAEKMRAAIRRTDAAREINDAKKDGTVKAIDKDKHVYQIGKAHGESKRQKVSKLVLGVVTRAITHNDVYIYTSVVRDGRRVFETDIPGFSQYREGMDAPNGFYDPETGAIYIDANSGNHGEGAILYTAAHELSHFVAQWAPEKFDALAAFLADTYGKMLADGKTNVSFQDLIRAQMQKDPSLSFAEAREETVADAMSLMFRDGDLLQRVMELSAYKQGRSITNSIRNFLARIAAKIAQVYNGLKADPIEARMLEGMKDEVDRLSDIFAQGIVESGAVFKRYTSSLNRAGFEYDSDTQSVYLSARYSTGTDNAANVDRDALAGMLADQLVKVGGMKKKEALRRAQALIASEELMSIAVRGSSLDFEGNPLESAIKSNSDYPQGSVDLCNGCIKRLPITNLTNALQRALPDDLFTADDYGDIRLILMNDGRIVACGLCFVEDRRKFLGEIASDFRKRWDEAVKTGGTLLRVNSKGEENNVVIGKDLADRYGVVPGPVKPSDMSALRQVDFGDSDSWHTLQKEHPEIAAAFEAFNNARGQSAGRLLLDRAEYKREILSWDDEKVRRVNDEGGLRVFSFSDFEPIHMMDLVQVIMDCAAKGVMIQGYTKQPDFARLVRNTHVKLNRSLIPYGATGIKTVNGKKVLAIDTVEGMDINSPQFLDESNNPDVGNNITGINDEQILLAMADDFIHYIIPFHTNKSKKANRKLGVGKWNNYKKHQSDRQAQNREDIARTAKAFKKNLESGMKRTKAWEAAVKSTKAEFKKLSESKMVNPYTDILPSDGVTDLNSFVSRYLEICKEKNLVPRFPQFLDVDDDGSFVYKPGYEKFLLDFKLFDQDGRILPQMPVTADFDLDVMREIFEKENQKTEADRRKTEYPADLFDDVLNYIKAKHGYKDVDRERYNRYRQIVAETTEKSNSDENGLPGSTITPTARAKVKESSRNKTNQDAAYIRAVESGDMETAQRMVDEAAKAAGYTVRAYHGTNQGNFTVFDWDKTQRADAGWFGRGHYFSPHRGGAAVYGKRVIKAALKIDKPFNFDDEIYTYDGKKPIRKNPNIENLLFRINMSEKFPSVFGGRNVSLYDNDTSTAKDVKWTELRRILEDEIAKLQLLQFSDGHYEWKYDHGIFGPSTQEGYQTEKAANEDKVFAAIDLIFTDKYNIINMPIDPTAYYLGGDMKAANAFSETLKKKGYDGVLQAQNGDEIVVYDSNQIKTAEPVTYDDEGNVIPLSERFNEERDDIRYSRRNNTEDLYANRERLVQALTTTARTPAENDLLNRYAAGLDDIRTQERELMRIEEQIAEIDALPDQTKEQKAERSALLQQANAAKNRIAIYDTKLTRLEDMKPIREAMDNVRRTTRKSTIKTEREREKNAAIRETMQIVKADLKQQAQLERERRRTEKAKAEVQTLREARARDIERRHATQTRNKIKDLRNDLAKRVKRGRGKRSVAEELIDSVINVLEMIDTTGEAEYRQKRIRDNGSEYWHRLTAVESAALTEAEIETGLADGTLRRIKAKEEREAEFLALEDLREVYHRLHAMDDANGNETRALFGDPNRHNYATGWSAEIEKALTDLISELRGMPLWALDVDQLEAVYSTLKIISNTITDAGKKLSSTGGRSIYQDAGDTIAQQEKLSDIRSKRNRVIRKIDDTFGNLFTNAIRRLHEMADYDEDSPLYRYVEDINDGLRRANAFQMRETKKIEALRGKKEFRRFYADAVQKVYDGLELNDQRGGTFKISLMQIMQFLLTYEREQANDNHNHLAGNVFFPDVELMREGKYEEAADLDHVHEMIAPDETVINAMYKAVSGNQMAKYYMDAAREVFSDCATAINEVSRIMYGVPIARDKAYIPYVVSEMYTAMNTDNIQQDATLEGSGMLKELIPGSKAPLVMAGLNNVLDGHLKQTAKIYGLMIPVRNVNALLNARMTADDGGQTVKGELLRAWGKNGVELISKAIADVQTPRRDTDASALAKFVGKIKNLMVRSTLAGSISVATKQVASYFSSMPYLDRRALTAGVSYLRHYFSRSYTQGIYDEIDAHTAAHWMRRQGMSLPELADANQGGAITRLREDHPIVNKLSPYNWIQNNDMATTAALWVASKNQIGRECKKAGIEIGSEEYWARVTDLYNRVIENTQPMYDPFHRAEIAKSRRLVNIIMFKTQPLQNAGAIRESAKKMQAYKRNYGKDSRQYKAACKEFRGATQGVIVSSIVFTALTVIAQAINHRLDDYLDDETGDMSVKSFIEKFGYDALKNILSNTVPVLGELAWGVAELITGKSSYDPISDYMVDQIVTAVSKFARLKKDPSWDNVINVATMIADAFGVPAGNVMRTIRGVIGYVNDFTGKDFMADAIGAGITGTNKKTTAQKIKSVYDALLSGDETRIAETRKMYDNASDYETAVKNGLRTYEPRIREAALARKSMDMDEYERLCGEIAAEGAFPLGLVKESADAELKAYANKIKTIVESEAAGDDDAADKAREDLIGKEYDKSAIDADVAAAQVEHKDPESESEWWDEYEPDETSSTNYSASDIDAVLATGDSDKIRRMIQDIYDRKKDTGSDDPDKATISAVKSGIGRIFKAGDIGEQEAIDLLTTYTGLEETDAYWQIEKWSGPKDNSSKYWRIFSAAENGEDISDIWEAYQQLGAEPKNLASAIFSRYRDRYKTMDADDRAIIKEYILDFLDEIGYRDRYDNAETIDGWIE